MARTGRFGRLPTEAPDLSSQIVALMEQWMNAEDRNILDAWTNGGRYKGKKVTDRQILNHYRQRRNSYDRDDPEWDEWNQDLWQMRYQISDEKVQMAYRMGRIGPAAVAAHYRSWARKMPRNSSYYRNLMATAGDFAKAARAAQQKAASAFDYEAMMNHINGLDRQLKPTEDFFSVVNDYAISRGLILPGEDIRNPGVLTSWEAADLNALLDGVVEDPAWERRGTNRIDFTNEGGVRGRITSERIDDMVQRAVQLHKEKIRTYQKAPYDMSGYIKAERDAIRDIRAYGNLSRQRGVLDVGSYLSTAFDIWTGSPNDRVSSEARGGEEGRAGAIDPTDTMSGDPVFADALRRAVRDYKRLGMVGEAAAAEALLKAVTITPGEAQDTDWLQQLDPNIVTTLFGTAFSSPGAIAELAQNQMALRNAVELMNSGQAVISYDLPTVGGAEQALGEAARLPYRVLALERRADGATIVKDAISEQQWLKDPTMEIVQVLDSHGKQMPALVNSKPIYAPDGRTLVGYRLDYPHSTARLWGAPDPENPGVIRYTAVDPWADKPGITLSEGDGTLTMVVDPDVAQRAAETGGALSPTIDLSIGEAVQTALDALPADTNLTPEQRTRVEGALTVLEDDLNEQDYSNILSDPAKLEAYRRAFPADFASVEQFRGQQGLDGQDLEPAAVLAAARESLRNRHGYDLPTTAEDMRFFTPEGYVRSANTVAIEDADAHVGDVGLRQQILDQYEGQSIGQALAQQRQSMGTALTGTGQAMDLTGGAYGLTDAPTTQQPQGVVDEVDAIERMDPTIQNDAVTGNYEAIYVRLLQDATKSGSVSPGLVAATVDDNLRKAFEEDPTTFTSIAAMNLDNQVEADEFAQDYGAVWALGTYAPELALMSGKGASGQAVDAGRLMGIERNMQAATSIVAQAAAERSPWAPLSEPQARAVSAGFATPLGPPAPTGSLMGAGPETMRADQMTVLPRETTVPVKPQPSVKLSQSLTGMLFPQVAVQKAAQEVKVAQMPSPISLPKVSQPLGPPAPMQQMAPPKPAAAPGTAGGPLGPPAPQQQTLSDLLWGGRI